MVGVVDASGHLTQGVILCNPKIKEKHSNFFWLSYLLRSSVRKFVHDYYSFLRSLQQSVPVPSSRGNDVVEGGDHPAVWCSCTRS